MSGVKEGLLYFNGSFDVAMNWDPFPLWVLGQTYSRREKVLSNRGKQWNRGTENGTKLWENSLMNAVTRKTELVRHLFCSHVYEYKINVFLLIENIIEAINHSKDDLSIKTEGMHVQLGK